MKLDPTRTSMLRRQYSRMLSRLYREFGKGMMPVLLAMVDGGVPMDQVDTVLEQGIQERIIGRAPRIIRYNVTAAYRKAVNASSDELSRHNILSPGPTLLPLDYDALSLLQDINFNRVKSCTAAMKDAITYACSKGVINGWGPEQMAREIRRCVNGNNSMGIVRARVIARTEVLNAYNLAAETRYRAAGLTHSDLIWIAASDERTCSICMPRDGKTIGEIGEIPPAHPLCRCCTGVSPGFQR